MKRRVLPLLMIALLLLQPGVVHAGYDEDNSVSSGDVCIDMDPAVEEAAMDALTNADEEETITFVEGFDEPLGKNNSNYTYNTIDGTTVTSTANGRPKLLIFFKTTCWNSQTTMKSMRSLNWEGVDIVAVEANYGTKEEVIQFKDTYGIENAAYSYDTYYNNNRSMWNYIYLKFSTNTITFPVIVYIDGNNKVQHITSGLSSADGILQGLKYYCAYTTKVSKISLNKSALTLEKGQNETLKATVTPDNADNKSLAWKSSNTKVVTVDSNGKVMAVGVGTATITVTAQDGGGASASCKVTVTKPFVAPPKFNVKGVFGGRDVTFTSDTKGAVIYYSTKSSNPTTTDTKVANGATVRFSDFYGTVYAKAYYNGEWSNVAKLVLQIPVVKDPTITREGNKVTIRCATPDSYVYYTLDGSTPSPENGIKIAPNKYATFEMTGGTVKAIAVRSCFTDSKVVEEKIASSVSSSVKVPSFKVVGVFGGREVTFTSEPGAEIYYSTSSTMTSKDSHVKSGGSVVFSDFYGTIYARSYKDGKWSNPARLILKIPTINTPTITDHGNGYVTLRTTTPDCYLYYTTDGSTPSMTNGKRIAASASKIYVGTGKTVKVIAVRSCFTNSKMATYKN